MLKIENTEVLGWEHAIRGMRNPKNSWEKSDSTFHLMIDDDKAEDFIGENDLKLMTTLRNAGTDHRKFMRMITVYLGWIDCTDTYLMYRKWIKPRINFQQLKRKVSRYDKYDEKRVYQKLVSLYTAKGGKSHGVKLQVCREHSPTDCT